MGMKSLKGSPDEKIYSKTYPRHAKLLESNLTMRKLVFETYDNVVQRQLERFLALFTRTLHATFANPWVFMKHGTAKLEEGDIDDENMMLPSLDDTKERI